MDPETENLINEAVEARLRWWKVEAEAVRLRDDYRNALSRAVNTGVRGVKIEIARRSGVSDETIRLDASESARLRRDASRRKSA